MTDIVERLRELYRFAAQQKSRDWDEMDEVRVLFKQVFDIGYEAVEEIERLREALCDCHHVLHKLMAIVPGNDTAVDEMAKVMKKARAALGEGEE